MTETRTEYTTKLCPQCKHPLKERRFTEDLEQVCPDCGHVFDEDEALQPDRLAEIEARLAAATAGPWKWRRYGDEYDAWWKLETLEGQRILDDGSACNEYNQEIDPEGPDADLIAHAPIDLHWMIDEIKRLRLQVEQLAEALEVVTQ